MVAKADMSTSRKGEARIMQRVWRLLQRLPLERRRKVLERLTASQKRALECWILGHAGNATNGSMAMVTSTSTIASGRAKTKVHQPTQLKGVRVAQNIVHYRRGKVTYYAAQMQLGFGLRMLSKTERCLEVAQQHELFLQRVRETCHAAAPQKELMGQAIREVLVGEEAKKMGLRFVVQIRIPWSRSTLTSPPFRLSNLELGLQAWHRLHDARERILSLSHGNSQRGRANVAQAGVQRAWQQLREAYLASTRHSPRAISRIRMLEAEFRLRCKRDLDTRIEKEVQQTQADRAEEQLQALLSRWNQPRFRRKVRHYNSSH